MINQCRLVKKDSRKAAKRAKALATFTLMLEAEVFPSKRHEKQMLKPQ